MTPDLRDDGKGGWTVHVDGALAGHAFPVRVDYPAQSWFGRRTGARQVAVRFPGEHLAVSYVLRRCTDLDDNCPTCGPTIEYARSNGDV